MTQNNEKKAWLLQKIVLPQNTDHAGVMWHGSYLSWLEEARINALSQVGMSYKDISNEGFELPVVDLQIRYISPLIHGEQVLIKSWVSRGKGPRWKWETKFLRDSDKADAIANIDLVLIKKTKLGKHQILRKAPHQIAKALSDLQNGPL